ncbi:MAG: hypothetical protein VW338_14080 [Rhodospirillaceae bacterium]|jgi:hypothetical protein
MGFNGLKEMRPLLLALGIVALAACETTPMIAGGDSGGGQAGTKSASGFGQFPDIPIPSGTKINTDKTLVFGTKPWYGQLSLASSSNANALFDFYRESLPQYGWQEVTAVRAPTSILTYATPERVLAIAIQNATFSGSNVTVTVSPRGQPAAAPAPPMGSAPVAPVQRLNQ